MDTSGYIMLFLAGGIVLFAATVLSQPRHRTVPPKFGNVQAAFDIGTSLFLGTAD